MTTASGEKPAARHLMSRNFSAPRVSAEAGLGDHVVPQLQGSVGGRDRVAAVGDVGEGAAVDEGGGVLQGLDQIGADGVLQQGGHGPLGLQIGAVDWLPGAVVGHHHPAQPGLQVREVGGQAEHGHDLRGHGDVEAVLPRDAVHLAPQAADDVPELPVVHVHAPPPGDPAHVDVQGIALLDVVVQHGGQEVVGRPDGMEVPSEVEVDVLHGHHLGVAAPPAAPPFTPKTGPREGSRRARITFFPSRWRASARPTLVVVLPSPAGVGLMAVTRMSFPFRGASRRGQGVHLGLIAAVVLQQVLFQARLGRDLGDGQQLCRLGDLDSMSDFITASPSLSVKWCGEAQACSRAAAAVPMRLASATCRKA